MFSGQLTLGAYHERVGYVLNKRDGEGPPFHYLSCHHIHIWLTRENVILAWLIKFWWEIQSTGLTNWIIMMPILVASISYNNNKSSYAHAHSGGGLIGNYNLQTLLVPCSAAHVPNPFHKRTVWDQNQSCEAPLPASSSDRPLLIVHNRLLSEPLTS